VSAYRTAIDRTTAIIDRRATYFRNQIVIVVGIVAVAAVGAFAWSAAALWAVLLLVPACGLFFYVDSRVLTEWRSGLLEPWIARELDLVAWCQAIHANPVLPKETTAAMLATLPSARDLVAEQKILTPTRRAIAATCLALHRSKSDSLLLNAIASGVVVAILLAALWTGAWVPLLGLIALGPLPLVRRWIARWRRVRCETQVAVCRTQVGFSEEEYATARQRLA
jgi:hypothetical protein